MGRTADILNSLPDCDDTLRRLADLLQMSETCRKRACRREGSCGGGYGPPCFFEQRQRFADTLRDHMHTVREHWATQRRTIAALLKR